MVKRLWRLVRSRRLAVGLISAVAAYSIAATLVPVGRSVEPEVEAWASAHPFWEPVAAVLGLHRGFTSPLFLALALLLCVCTAACSVERTQRALGLRRSFRAPLSERRWQALIESPRFSVDVPEGVSAQEAQARAEGALRRLRLSVEGDGRRADARSLSWGLLGSPLFHWALVATMVFVATGQATRAEGLLGLPIGTRVTDERVSYIGVTEGPLFGGRFSELEFVATELDRRHTVDGVMVGPAPIVTAYRSGAEVASGRVYPNSPLRVGALMVHMVDFGPAVTVAVETTGGAEAARSTLLLERDSHAEGGIVPQELVVATPERVRVRVSVPVRSAPVTVSTAVVETATPSGDYGPAVETPVGDALVLPSGQRLRIVDVRDWVSVTVANDWSVPWLYALFTLSILALSVAILMPARRVLIALVEDDEGVPRLHGLVWSSSRDSGYEERVADSVAAAVRGGEAE